MPRPIPIGVDDFRTLRTRGMEYVDKSHLIREVLDKGAQALLLPRPRRFGKTLAMSMLRCFLEKRAEDFAPLFADLSIWRAGPEYREHFQRYPVIFLTLKDVKEASWEECLVGLGDELAGLYREHAYLLEGDALLPSEREAFTAILNGTASPPRSAAALRELSRLLARHHGQPVVILIDEYDTPLHAAHHGRYYEQAAGYLRKLLSGGLKDNPHLFKGVLTGVLRVAKESIFSGLNNLAVYTLLRPDFATCFGFTEAEVVALLERVGREDRLDAVRAWYDGYVFGGEVIYNPWSILNYIDGPEPEPRPFWVATSANELVRESLVRHAATAHDDIEALLEGRGVLRRLDENVALGDLHARADTLFGLLTFSGYLRADKQVLDPEDEPHYQLSIPNREVRRVYTSTFREWMTDRMGSESAVERLARALLSGDAEALEEELVAFTGSVLSYYDVPSGGAVGRGTVRRPEQVYHAFVIGLLATLESDYEVRSNRESGEGRPDVMLRPRRAGLPGAVLELKVARAGKATLEEALAEGARQLRERDYGRELRAAGVSPVYGFAVAFDGRDVRVVGV